MTNGNKRKRINLKRLAGLIALGLMFLASVEAAPTTGKPWLDDIYHATARRYGVPVEILIAQGRQESGFRQFAMSNKGAAGPAQFIPGTAIRYGLKVTHDPRTDERFDYVKAIDAQGRYMRDLLRRFNGRLDLALAGYNAGEGRVERLGRVPNGEPTGYVRAILANSGFTRPTQRSAVPRVAAIPQVPPKIEKPAPVADRTNVSLFGADGGKPSANAVSMVFSTEGGRR